MAYLLCNWLAVRLNVALEITRSQPHLDLIISEKNASLLLLFSPSDNLLVLFSMRILPCDDYASTIHDNGGSQDR